MDPSADAAAIGGALLLRASMAADGQAVTALLECDGRVADRQGAPAVAGSGGQGGGDHLGGGSTI